MKYFALLSLFFVFGCGKDNGSGAPERPLTLEEVHFSEKSWCEKTEVKNNGEVLCDIRLMHTFTSQFSGYSVTVASMDLLN
ncbi:MAG: hypothetical protein HRT44_09675 [Bdellovibrionales bacterium]|nr:hypothetical protein [Bdellovibrionales bacterium]NQZ19508.1 hypothetical protein [Bdellovibrionales bacterium]